MKLLYVIQKFRELNPIYMAAASFCPSVYRLQHKYFSLTYNPVARC